MTVPVPWTIGADVVGIPPAGTVAVTGVDGVTPGACGVTGGVGVTVIVGGVPPPLIDRSLAPLCAWPKNIAVFWVELDERPEISRRSARVYARAP